MRRKIGGIPWGGNLTGEPKVTVKRLGFKLGTDVGKDLPIRLGKYLLR